MQIPPILSSLLLLVVLVVHQAEAKPRPSPPAEVAKPTPPKTGEDPAVPLARWLMTQDGGPNAICLPLGAVIEAATGKPIIPFDRKDPADAAFAKLLGEKLDAVLPLMNKPESSAHRGASDVAIGAAFADALADGLKSAAGMTITGTKIPAGVPAGSYPAFSVATGDNGRSYGIGIHVFTTEGRDKTMHALSVRPETAAGLTASNGCLLIAVETNGKTGQEAAFLNWELIDVSSLPVRATISFEGTQEAVHTPGAKLDDGRKGND